MSQTIDVGAGQERGGCGTGAGRVRDGCGTRAPENNETFNFETVHLICNRLTNASALRSRIVAAPLCSPRPARGAPRREPFERHELIHRLDLM
ncbi:hypothetical protein EVAR_65137_1 [Eumeta japonica]|uniref:Uncharacterized protein n=1 Tax=Eumeta variegata TaxID=151549 RepID=A0A4C1Z3Y9_EUMVA|nr:hypothetical protein EVAR_65137_1 [Eumeta japonica]